MSPTTDKSRIDEAVRRAVRLLRVRERTRAELVERLRAAGFSAPTVDAALARLGRLVDDARAAEAHAHRATARGPVARELLSTQLEARGVETSLARDTARRALPPSESQAARLAALRAARRLPATLDPATRWRRVLSALARAGFEQELALDAARAVLGSPPNEH